MFETDKLLQKMFKIVIYTLRKKMQEGVISFSSDKIILFNHHFNYYNLKSHSCVLLLVNQILKLTSAELCYSVLLFTSILASPNWRMMSTAATIKADTEKNN